MFFDVLALLLGSGSTVVAEAAFQGPVWRPRLECLTRIADVRIVRCMVDPATANVRNTRRAVQNPRRARAHPAKPGPLPEAHPYEPISIGAPSLTVDTTDGYVPALTEIVAFIDRA